MNYEAISFTTLVTFLIVVFVLFVASQVIYEYKKFKFDKRLDEQRKYYEKRLDEKDDLYENDRKYYMNKILEENARENFNLETWTGYSQLAGDNNIPTQKMYVTEDMPIDGVNKDAFRPEEADNKVK